MKTDRGMDMSDGLHEGDMQREGRAPDMPAASLSDALLDAMPQRAWLVDAGGRVLKANRGWRELAADRRAASEGLQWYRVLD